MSNYCFSHILLVLYCLPIELAVNELSLVVAKPNKNENRFPCCIEMVLSLPHDLSFIYGFAIILLTQTFLEVLINAYWESIVEILKKNEGEERLELSNSVCH